MRRLVIGILAHVDAGKTTLSEAVLYKSGAIRTLGRVDHGDAFLDTDALERERGITIYSKQAVFTLSGPDGETAKDGRPGPPDGDPLEVTLLDTPGHADFSAEMERVLRVLDCAVLVVSGTDGVQSHTRTLWRLLERYGVPTVLFVNKMDLDGADREKVLSDLKARLDSRCVDFGGAGEPWAEARTDWAEELALCDDALLEQYLDTGTLSDGDAAALIRRRAAFPCWFGSALKLDGVAEFLDGLRRFAPVPSYPADFGARIFKITRDSQGKRLAWMKITGGVLRSRTVLRHDGPEAWEEKADQLRVYSGEKFSGTDTAEAGTVAAVTGLRRARAGDGLGFEADWAGPSLEPALQYQLILPDGTDPHTAHARLQELEEEDPQLHVRWNGKSLSVRLMGEVQLEVLGRVLRERYGIDAAFGAGDVVYRETIAAPVEGVGHFEPLRHYAEVHLLLSPLPPGSGLVFDSLCPEDALDRNWQRLILTHLAEREHRGVLTGSPITDMRISLTAGRAHVKHTEGGDFREATYRAVRQGLMGAENILLEPWYAFRLEVPASQLGRALSDIQRMDGEAETEDPSGTYGGGTSGGGTSGSPGGGTSGVSGGGTSGTSGGGTSGSLSGGTEAEAVLVGTAPVSRIRDYAREVAAYTRGLGRLSFQGTTFRPCVRQEEVISSIGYDPDRDVDNPSGSVFCSHGAGVIVPWEQVPALAHVQTGIDLSSWGTEAGEDRDTVGNGDAGFSGSSGGSGYGFGGRGSGYGSGGSGEDGGRGSGSRGSGGDGGRGSGYGGAVDYAGRAAMDKELEAIFRRTYGEKKEQRQAVVREARPPDRRNRTDGGNSGTGRPARVPKGPEYLLVDGYNIIYAWDGLHAIAEDNLDAARKTLCDLLCEYRAVRGCVVIVVFDAYKVKGNPGSHEKYRNIDVVYTKEAETADAYIERATYEIGREHRVRVATSDGPEQMIILGHGALRVSASMFREEMEEVRARIAEALDRVNRPARTGAVGAAIARAMEEQDGNRAGKEQNGSGAAEKQGGNRTGKKQDG